MREWLVHQAGDASQGSSRAAWRASRRRAAVPRGTLTELADLVAVNVCCYGLGQPATPDHVQR